MSDWRESTRQVEAFAASLDNVGYSVSERSILGKLRVNTALPMRADRTDTHIVRMALEGVHPFIQDAHELAYQCQKAGLA